MPTVAFSLFSIQVPIEKCLPDVVVYCVIGALLCPVIALSFRSRMIAKNTYLPVMLSCLIVALLVIGDLAIPLFYTYNEDIPIRYCRESLTNWLKKAVTVVAKSTQRCVNLTVCFVA